MPRACLITIFLAVCVLAPRAFPQSSRESTPVILTQAAADQIKKMIKKGAADPAKTYLRIGCKKIAPRQYQYIIKLSTEPIPPADHRFESKSIPIAVDPKSASLLYGTTIDYKEVDGQPGFHFTNPNAD